MSGITGNAKESAHTADWDVAIDLESVKCHSDANTLVRNTNDQRSIELGTVSNSESGVT